MIGTLPVKLDGVPVGVPAHEGIYRNLVVVSVADAVGEPTTKAPVLRLSTVVYPSFQMIEAPEVASEKRTPFSNSRELVVSTEKKSVPSAFSTRNEVVESVSGVIVVPVDLMLSEVVRAPPPVRIWILQPVISAPAVAVARSNRIRPRLSPPAVFEASCPLNRIEVPKPAAGVPVVV